MTMVAREGSRGNLLCPECGHATTVKDSRAVQGLAIRRRRACISCDSRFTTYEVICDKAAPVGATIEGIASRFNAIMDQLTALSRDLSAIETVTRLTKVSRLTSQDSLEIRKIEG